MPRGVATVLALVLCLCLGAGCLDGPDRSDRDGADGAGASAAGAYAFDCSGAETERRPGVCVRQLAPVGTQLTEPALAWHPGDRGILAVGAHAVGAASALAGGAAVAPAVYTTRDGGATWQERLVPLPPGGPGWFAGDPAVAFTPEGRLHYAAMAMDPAEMVTGAVAPTVGPRLFVAWSDDLGATWSDPVVLASGMDREWFAVGPDGTLYLSWQVYREKASFVAWSTDSGATWSQPVRSPDDCITASPVAFLAGAPHLACSVADDDSVAQHVLRLDAATQTLEAAFQAPVAGIAPRLLPAADGRVVVTTYSGGAAVSADGGATWPAWAWVPDLVTVDDGWDHAPQVYWSESDGQVVHLLLSEYHRTPTPVTAGYHEPQDPHPVAHVVLAAQDLSVLHEGLLTPDGTESTAAPPSSAVPLLGDDWYAMAWHGGDLALAWAWAGGIDIAIVQAEPNRAPV